MNKTNPEKITTISIRNRTRSRLDDLKKRLGNKRIGFDKLINGMLDHFEEQEQTQEK